jgi:hypothetical protein
VVFKEKLLGSAQICSRDIEDFLGLGALGLWLTALGSNSKAPEISIGSAGSFKESVEERTKVQQNYRKKNRYKEWLQSIATKATMNGRVPC